MCKLQVSIEDSLYLYVLKIDICNPVEQDMWQIIEEKIFFCLSYILYSYLTS